MARALPFVLVLLVGYAFLVRPVRRRAKETSVLQTMLSPGDQVMLTSGIFGRVETVVDDKFTVEIAPGVVVTVHRGAIGKIVRDVPDDTALDLDGIDDSEFDDSEFDDSEFDDAEFDDAEFDDSELDGLDAETGADADTEPTHAEQPYATQTSSEGTGASPAEATGATVDSDDDRHRGVV